MPQWIAVRRGSAMVSWISFLAGWDGPPRRARGKLSKRTARIRGATTNEQRVPARRETTSNAEWGICFAGAVGVCDGELDWRIDFADGAGNGRVRKPGIRAVKTLRNLSQTHVMNCAIFQLRRYPACRSVRRMKWQWRSIDHVAQPH